MMHNKIEKSFLKSLRVFLPSLVQDFSEGKAQKVIACISSANLIVLAVTLVVLVLNLRSVSKQIVLTQTLNQPFCAVEAVVVKPTNHPNEFNISAILKNYGKYRADKVSMTWEIKSLEIDSNRKIHSERDLFPRMEAWQDKIILLPEQRLEELLLYISRTVLENMVVGYQKVLFLKIIVEYEYSVTPRMDSFEFDYLIMRLSGEKDRYDALLKYSGRVKK